MCAVLLHRGWFHYIALRPTCFFCRHACFRRCLHRRHYPHSPFCCPQSAQQVIVYKQHFNVGQQCRLFSPQCRRHLRKDVLKRRNTLKRLYIRFRRSSTARNGRAADRLRGRFEFSTNGRNGSVKITASGVNAIRLRGETIDRDTRLADDKPYIIYDSLVVAPEAVLTVAPGTKLCFHDKASLIVHGSLIAEATPQQQIILSGDRTGNVVGIFLSTLCRDMERRCLHRIFRRKPAVEYYCMQHIGGCCRIRRLPGRLFTKTTAIHAQLPPAQFRCQRARSISLGSNCVWM